jgi:23S rRNA pseudouridine2605 synthase
MTKHKTIRKPARRVAPAKPRKAAPSSDRTADAEADDEGDEPAAEAGPKLVRLNKYLADRGIASRRKCDELIQAGKVSVDGEPMSELGARIDPNRQAVEIDGYVLKPVGMRKRYYLLNKPGGVVCTNEARETRPRAVDLITDPSKGRIYTVGRLDEESKGLILLTNDGEFANRIMHPRYGIEKTYTVRVHGEINDETLDKIRTGVHLSEGRTAGAKIFVDRRTREYSLLTVLLREGMNREIRRVFARFGYKVIELRRTRIGHLTPRGIKIGKWRELTRSEVDDLVSGRAAAAAETDARSSHHTRSRRPPTRDASSRPRNAGGRPAHTGGRPAHAGGRPRHEGGRPRDGGARPPHASARPQRGGGRSRDSGKPPRRAIGHPLDRIAEPQYEGAQSDRKGAPWRDKSAQSRGAKGRGAPHGRRDRPRAERSGTDRPRASAGRPRSKSGEHRPVRKTGRGR